MQLSPMATAAQEANQLDSVTDYHEEKEMDKNAVQNAMKELAAAETAAKKGARAKEKALAKVEIDQKDVELIDSEFEIGKEKAERVLREHGGDVRKALTALIDEPMAHEPKGEPVAQVTLLSAFPALVPAGVRSTRHGGEVDGEYYVQSAEAWAKTHADATAAFKAEHGEKADPSDPMRYTAPPPYFQMAAGHAKPGLAHDATDRMKRIFEGDAEALKAGFVQACPAEMDAADEPDLPTTCGKGGGALSVFD